MPFSRDPQELPHDTSGQPGQHTKTSVIAPIVLWLALIGAVEISVQQEQLRAQSNEMQHLGDNSNEVRTLFEYELNSTLHLATGLVAYIQSKNGQLIADELTPWLGHLQEHSPYIRNIGIAPGNRIQFIYPTEGNESALGLYYPEDAKQWPAVEKAILNRQPTLAGPVELRQGGKGLIYRVPVYLSNKDYWGLVSTVLNLEKIYATINTRAEQLGIKVAIQDQDDNGQILFGNAKTQQHYALTLNVPGRNWQMISSQVEDNNTDFIYTRIIGWLLATAGALSLYWFLRALTRQHATSLALAESKYRFSQAFNSAPQGIALIARSGDLLDFNTSLCNSLGYNRAELQQLNFFSITAPGQRERLRSTLANNKPALTSDHQYESLLIHQDGQLINVIISLAPTLEKSDNCDWIVQIIDISRRVAFEHLLKEEAQYNQAILNAVVDGIMIVDNTGQIRSANPATGIIFDSSHDQLLEQHITQFIQDPNAGDIMRQIKYHGENATLKAMSNREMRGVKADGQMFPLELQLSSIERKSEKLFIVVMRDISERKRLDRMKNEFISIISHELRTPLTAVLGSLRLLNSGTLDNRQEQAKQVIGIANQNGNKLARLIDDLLDMDKLLAGKMQFDFKIQSLHPLVAQAIEQNSVYAAQHQTSIVLHTISEPLNVNIDGHRLQQVLANLLSNAAKFSPPQAVIDVTVSEQKGRVKISVQDKGIGIPLIVQQNLFQKFYQVDSSNTRQKGGTGLGLAIAKQLTEAMHGTIGVMSEEGKGSCFFIELPLIQYTVAQHG